MLEAFKNMLFSFFTIQYAVAFHKMLLHSSSVRIGDNQKLEDLSEIGGCYCIYDYPGLPEKILSFYTQVCTRAQNFLQSSVIFWQACGGGEEMAKKMGDPVPGAHPD